MLEKNLALVDFVFFLVLRLLYFDFVYLFADLFDFDYPSF